MPPIQIDKEKCTGCSVCESICPGDVIRILDDVAVAKYPDDCWYCGCCEVDCKEGAISLKLPYLVR